MRILVINTAMSLVENMLTIEIMIANDTCNLSYVGQYMIVDQRFIISDQCPLDT